MARGGKYLESNFGISFVKKERRKKTCHFNLDSNIFLVENNLKFFTTGINKLLYREIYCPST